PRRRALRVWGPVVARNRRFFSVSSPTLLCDQCFPDQKLLLQNGDGRRTTVSVAEFANRSLGHFHVIFLTRDQPCHECVEFPVLPTSGKRWDIGEAVEDTTGVDVVAGIGRGLHDPHRLRGT